MMALSAEQFEDRIRLAEKARSGTLIGDASPPVPGTRALAAVERCYSSAKALTDRVEELAGILCGSRTAVQAISPAAARGPFDGLLPELEQRSAELADSLDAAHNAITRIRNHLPS